MRRTLILLIVALLMAAVPAALAWQESPTYADWWYIDPQYVDYHVSGPLVIELNGDSSPGQTFIVGETITISAYLHAYAASCAGTGNEAYIAWGLEVSGPSGPDSDTGSQYDWSDIECADVEEITTLAIAPYTLTAVGTHTVHMYSYAAAVQYWQDVAEEYVDAELTFEVLKVTTASLWLNLANTDDIGTYFDVKVDVTKGDSAVALGTLDCLKPARVASTPVSIPLTVTDPVAFDSGETFSLTVSVRIGEGAACVGKGHKDGTLQLQYDSVTRNSNVHADFGAWDYGTYYLHQGNVMNTNAPTLLKASMINRHPDRTKAGNPWVIFATWTSTPLP